MGVTVVGGGHGSHHRALIGVGCGRVALADDGADVFASIGAGAGLLERSACLGHVVAFGLEQLADEAASVLAEDLTPSIVELRFLIGKVGVVAVRGNLPTPRERASFFSFLPVPVPVYWSLWAPVCQRL